ncbi:MAG: hypothetical protein WCD55_07055 [Bacteroidales bacterium]
MDSGAVGNNSDIIKDQTHNKVYPKNLSIRESNISRLFDELSDDVREDLINYLDRMGLVNEAGMLVIPSTRHYFYDADDMKGVRTVVNLKQLNHVREIRDFLRNIADLLPHKSNFVGCFVDNKIQNGFSDKYSNLPRQISEKAEAYENGIESRIPFINRMYSFIDSRTNRYLTKRAVTRLLEESGLQLVGMTEVNGLTYFWTQKTKPAA